MPLTEQHDMSDVLLYNAIKRNFELNRTNANDAAAIAGAAAGAAAGSTAFTGGLAAFTNANSQVGFFCAANSDTWKSIPRMCGETGSIRVCDTSGFFRCGSTCTWTVPAGVTCAEFQIWGPGGGTSSNCCCGGAPFGPTGAWAIAILPVSAGQVYTICAGCATCCYASQTTPGLRGGTSFVTGPNLSNFCALGGASCICEWRASIAGVNFNGNCYPGGGGCQLPSGIGCGPESCSGWNFCFDNATGDRVRMDDYTFSCTTKWCGTATGGVVYGISGMYPRMNFGGMGNNYCGYTRAAPVYGFENQSQCMICYLGTTCSGCNYAPGIGGIPILCNPGSGGAGGPVYGGCNACGGDSGRMGMACVRWR